MEIITFGVEMKDEDYFDDAKRQEVFEIGIAAVRAIKGMIIGSTIPGALSAEVTVPDDDVRKNLLGVLRGIGAELADDPGAMLIH